MCGKCTRLQYTARVMVGDGKSGDSNNGDEGNGPESESGAPSSRRRQALLAARLAAGDKGSQPSANAARAVLERDLHRFQAASRHDRLKRKKAQRGGTARAETTVDEQPTARTGRTRAVTSSKSRNGVQSSQGVQSFDSTPARENAAPDPLEIEAPLSRRPGRTQYDPTEPDWAARWQGPAPAADSGPLDESQPDMGLADAAPPDSSQGEVTTDDEASSNDAGATTQTQADAAPSRRKQRKQRKPSANSAATRLLLPAVRAKWQAEVAAFGGRREPPPREDCPTDYREAYDLTAEERRAIPKERIRHPNAKVGKLVQCALAAALRLEPWRDEMACLPVDLAKIDRLRSYIRAVSHADAELAMTLEVEVPDVLVPGETMVLTRQQIVQRMLQRALAARGCLHSEVKALIKLGRIPPGALSNLAGGNGHYNTAKDVLALIELLRTAVGSGAASNIPEDQLERYTLLAYKLIEASSLNTTNRGGAARAQALEERSRAYTLLWLAYRQALRALTYIFWDECEVSVVLPSLVVGAGRKPGR